MVKQQTIDTSPELTFFLKRKSFKLSRTLTQNNRNSMWIKAVIWLDINGLPYNILGKCITFTFSA